MAIRDLLKLRQPGLSPGVLPLAKEGRGSLSFWRDEIGASKELIAKERDRNWNRNLQSYRGQTLLTQPIDDTVVVPRDFSYVEQKAAQLFFQTPEIHLTARQGALQEAVPVFQAILNYYLSEDGVNALATMNEVAFDALCPAGIMVSKIGYESFSQGSANIPLQAGLPPTAPTPPAAPGMETSGVGTASPSVPGEILGLSGSTPPSAPPAPPSPATVDVPNIVYERFFWERISPAAVLIPKAFSGSVYDKAQWLGWRNREPWNVLVRKFNLPAHIEKPSKGRWRSGASSDDALKLKSTSDDDTPSPDDVEYVEVYYRAAYFDPNEAHPEKFRQLVLIDGLDIPVVHRDAPYQRTGPDGKLTGMLGNAIHIGALRYVSDTSLPPSECTIARTLNEELNKGRTQMLRQRDRAMAQMLINLSAIGGEQGLEKFKQNVQQGRIPLKTIDPNNPAVAIVTPPAYPRENFSFNDILDSDLGRVWSMSANQTGQESEGDITATEAAKIDQWATTRLDKERRNLLAYFIAGVRKLGSLIQTFAPDGQLVEVIGSDQVPKLTPWNRQLIQGQFAYKINPDSSIRIDQVQAQQRALKLYEQLGRDPNVNRNELLVNVCRAWNLDPQKIINQQPPEKGPDPAAISMRLDPMAIAINNPNLPMYLAMLQEAGYKSLLEPSPMFGGMTPVQAAMAFAQFQTSVMGMAEGGGQPAGMDPSQIFAGAGAGAGAQGQPGQPGAPGQQEHPGTAPKMEHLSKHTADRTGERPGVKPMGPS